MRLAILIGLCLLAPACATVQPRAHEEQLRTIVLVPVFIPKEYGDKWAGQAVSIRIDGHDTAPSAFAGYSQFVWVEASGRQRQVEVVVNGQVLCSASVVLNDIHGINLVSPCVKQAKQVPTRSS